jgi:hypothetical protein
MKKTNTEGQPSEQASQPSYPHDGSYFPWLMEPSGNDVIVQNHVAPVQPPINRRYMDQLGKEAAMRIYGVEETPWTEDDLSVEGRMYLANIKDALDRLKDDFINSGGEMNEPVLVAGVPYKDYLDLIARLVTNETEYRYIMIQIDKMVSHVENVRRKVVEYAQQGLPVPKDMSGPKHRTKKPWI